MAHRVVIVGGGIAGLSAAYYVQVEARASGVPVEYTLVEGDKRLGGKILTEHVSVTPVSGADFLVEGGPDSFLTQKPWALELAREIGLGDQIIGVNREKQRIFVLIGGKPCLWPEGMLLVVPTRLRPFLLSPILSPWGKARLLLDYVLPAKKDAADETLADFIRRRLGAEALDRIAEPLLAGVHNAEPERQSILATFPRLRAIEETYGSLIRGMRAARAKSAGSGGSDSGFVSLVGGTEQLVRALVQTLSGRIVTGRRVEAVERGDGSGYRVRLDGDETLVADAVVMATPAYATADLLGTIESELADKLRHIRYVSTGTVSLAFRHAEVGTPLDGFGLIIPRSERRKINALSMSSIKYAGRAPADHLLLRAFVGGSKNPDALGLDDAALVERVRDELRLILGITAEPVFGRVYRWWQGNPQYDVGHLDRVAELEALCPPGLHLVGSAYRGVGIPDCVKHAKDTARALVAGLGKPVFASI